MGGGSALASARQPNFPIAPYAPRRPRCAALRKGVAKSVIGGPKSRTSVMGAQPGPQNVPVTWLPPQVLAAQPWLAMRSP